jgi:hypothetical protein
VGSGRSTKRYAKMIDELVVTRLKEILTDQNLTDMEINELSEILNSINISEFFQEFKCPITSVEIKKNILSSSKRTIIPEFFSGEIASTIYNSDTNKTTVTVNTNVVHELTPNLTLDISVSNISKEVVLIETTSNLFKYEDIGNTPIPNGTPVTINVISTDLPSIVESSKNHGYSESYSGPVPIVCSSTIFNFPQGRQLGTLKTNIIGTTGSRPLTEKSIDFYGSIPEFNKKTDITGMFSSLWLNNFSKILLVLKEKVSTGVLSEILSDNDFQKTLDPQTINELIDYLPPESVINISNSSDLSSIISSESLLGKLIAGGVVASSLASYFTNENLEKFKNDLNSFNSFMEATFKGQLDFSSVIKGLEDQFENFGKALSQDANNAFKSFINDINIISKTLSDTLPSDLKGVIDIGFGFSTALGASNNTGTFIKHSVSSIPRAEGSASTTGEVFNNLNSIIEGTLSQDWKTRNSDPGNPLILEAYRLSGRNYTQDGQTGEYVWNAAFVSWVLSKSGLEYIQTMSPMGYAGYGSPVEIGNFSKVRKNDIIIFNSAFGVAHIGFVREYDPRTNRVKILGGNQAGTVKLTELPANRGTPELYVSHIRRNWSIPADKNVPLYQPLLRPRQQTSGPQPLPSGGGPARYTPETPSERADRESGGSAASGGILL